MIFEHLLRVIAHLLSVGHWSILVIQPRYVGLILEHLVGKMMIFFAQCWTLEYLVIQLRYVGLMLEHLVGTDDETFAQCRTLEHLSDMRKEALIKC